MLFLMAFYIGSYGETEAAMLILTRRVGETLVIGDDVTVTVLGVKGNQVRLGVNAPRDLPVHREALSRGAPSAARPPHLNRTVKLGSCPAAGRRRPACPDKAGESLPQRAPRYSARREQWRAQSPPAADRFSCWIRS